MAKLDLIKLPISVGDREYLAEYKFHDGLNILSYDGWRLLYMMYVKIDSELAKDYDNSLCPSYDENDKTYISFYGSSHEDIRYLDFNPTVSEILNGVCDCQRTDTVVDIRFREIYKCYIKAHELPSFRSPLDEDDDHKVIRMYSRFNKSYLGREDEALDELLDNDYHLLGLTDKVILGLIMHVVMTNRQESILFLDLVDNEIPHMFKRDIMEILMEINPNAQFILNTHTPEVYEELSGKNFNKMTKTCR